MPDPLFGADHQFDLSIYNERHELIQEAVVPRLDYLSQSLGFVNHGSYEEIRQSKMKDHWKNDLLARELQKGKYELQRYLHSLRPILMEKHQIYFYCIIPSPQIKTIVETGHFSADKGKLILSALPMSVEAAQARNQSSERIRELAPQVAWLIPMLVMYRKVKATDTLIAYLDGWLKLLTPQQNEKMHTAFVRHAPHLINDEITSMLLARWEEYL